jgi:thioredoxin 1
MINNVNDFLETIKEGTHIVDFYADWCGPCRMLGPVIEKVATDKNISLVKINVDNLIDIARKYNINSIPNVFLFVDGAIKGSFLGYKDYNGVIKELGL